MPGSIKPVYGAMHPPISESPRGSPKMTKGHHPHHHKRTGSNSSFQDFQESTNDAWDVGDDEICIITDVAKSAALSVLNSHSKSVNPCRAETSEEGKTEAMQRLATQKEMLPMESNRRSSPPYGGSHHHLHGPGVGVRLSSPTLSSSSSFYLRHNHQLRHSSPNRRIAQPSAKQDGREEGRLEKFKCLLNALKTDLNELRQLSWSGVPPSVRGTVWRLLSGYLPANVERRRAALSRKREEYLNLVKQYYDTRLDEIFKDPQETYRQIHIDIPRMSPLVPLFQQEIVQEIFERILYVWAVRHPASGYVQGMNDLVTPFFVVFLQELVDEEVEIETYDVSQLSEQTLRDVEADTYWGMSKLLDGIQDNYTFAQPGIQIKVNQLKELIQRINAPLHRHLVRHHVEYLQFTFRWMNNLLMRELPLRCTIRLWDTYQSEPDGFATFHLYVCAAFLNIWSDELLKQRDFHSLMILLQNLPTHNWDNEKVSFLLAEAYRLKFTFADAPNHLQQNNTRPIATASK